MEEYVRNQDILSDFENLVITTSDITMDYDGYLNFYNNRDYTLLYVYINDTPVYQDRAESSFRYTCSAYNVFVKKGDTVRTNVNITTKARFYKLRDYSNRS